MALKLDFSKLPWQGQLGAVATLAVASVAGFWYFYASPAQTEINTQRAKLAESRAEVDRGYATAKRLPEFRKEVVQLEAQLDRLRAVLPEERDVADLLRRVQGLATQSNLRIKEFKPEDVTRRELHAEWPIELTLVGTYHDLGMFLERVSKFPRLINVGQLQVQTLPESTTATVTAKCRAMTFVLVDKDAPGAEKAVKGKGKAKAKPAKGAAAE